MPYIAHWASEWTVFVVVPDAIELCCFLQNREFEWKIDFFTVAASLWASF